MKRFDLLRRAYRSLSQAKIRTLLTSLAIGVGAFTLALSLAAGEGARLYTEKLFKNNIDPNAVMIMKNKGAAQGGASAPLEEYKEEDSSVGTNTGRMALLSNTDIAKLRERSDIKNIVPMYNVNPKYVSFEGSNKKYTTGLTYYNNTIKTTTSAGSLPELGQNIADNEAILPEDFLATLGWNPEQAIGKKITITLNKEGARPSSEEITKAMLTGGEAALKKLMGGSTQDITVTVRAVSKKNKLSGVSVNNVVVSPGLLEKANAIVHGSGDANRGGVVYAIAIATGSPEEAKKSLEKAGFSVSTAKEQQSMIFQFVNILQMVVGGFAALALIASVFGIINTQYISVLERTGQIGLMKALGMRRRDVARLFRYEAAWIGFLGSVIGVGVALLAGWALNPVIAKALDLDDHQLLQFVPWQIAVMVAALVVIAVVAGFFPSRKASKLDPIEALRTE